MLSHTEKIIQDSMNRCLEICELNAKPDIDDPFIDLLDLRIDKEGVLFYNSIIDKALRYKRYFVTDEDMSLISNLDNIYEKLADINSKVIFDWYIGIMTARILTQSLLKAEELYPYTFLDVSMAKIIKNFLHQIQVKGDEVFLIDGFIVKTTAPSLMETWTCETYKLDGICEVEPGDIVIDAGAYKGETAIWFAKEMQRKGKIYSFELVEEFSDIICHNVESNFLGHVITVVNYALWNTDTEINVHINDSLSVCRTDGEKSVIATTLDSYIKRNQIQKVDFIKMDLEGAELMALKGAEQTICKFAPKMAICIYHRLSHIYDVYKIISALPVKYKFYLSHKTHGPMNTIMYCVPIRSETNVNYRNC